MAISSKVDLAARYPNNVYVRDTERFRKALTRSVASSVAVETGRPVGEIVEMLENTRGES